MITSPVLSRDCSAQLLHMALHDQGDPLGYEAAGGSMEQDMDCDADQVNMVDELAVAALSDRGSRAARTLMQWPTLRCMDPVTAALLRGLGIDPAAALALADALGKHGNVLEIGCADAGTDTAFITANESYWTVRLSPLVEWMSKGVVLAGPMPATVLAAAIGRPLKALLSHPVLDGLDLTVTESFAGDMHCSITVDAPVADLAVADLQAMPA